MNNILGTKFKVVNGFPANQLDMAMERGEIDGRGSAQWHWWKFNRSDWVRDKKINILVQIGPHKDPDLPNVPLLSDLARTLEERQIFDLFSSTVTVGRPLLTPPDVPKERVKAMRTAFDIVMRDRAFLEDTKKLNLEIDPLSGEKLQLAVTAVTKTPADVIARAKIALGSAKSGPSGKDGSER